MHLQHKIYNLFANRSFFHIEDTEHPSPSTQTRRPHHVLGNDCTRISSPSLVSSLVHPVLGPSPFCKVCSQLILLSVSHFGKLCKDESKETAHECYFWITSWQKGRMCRDVHRASTSVHRGLAEGLADGEGDVGGADAGGCLDGQVVSLLADFHYGAGGRCHGHLPEENVDSWCPHKHNRCWFNSHPKAFSAALDWNTSRILIKLDSLGRFCSLPWLPELRTAVTWAPYSCNVILFRHFFPYIEVFFFKKKSII